MRRLLLALTLAVLALPSPAFARGEFDPTTEFEQHTWIPIHLGPLDLSITKAVVYLMIGTVGTILVGLVLMRGPTLTRPEAATVSVSVLLPWLTVMVAAGTAAPRLLKTGLPVLVSVTPAWVDAFP